MRRLSKSVIKKLEALKNVCAKEKPDGSWEIYDGKTGESFGIVTKEEADSATRRLNFRNSQRDRKISQ